MSSYQGIEAAADLASRELVIGSSPAEEVIQLFDEMRSPLLRYALTTGLSAEDGEEVIQEVFLALFRHLKSGKSRQNLRGWLFRVAHNLALKQRQKSIGKRLVEPGDEAAQRQPSLEPSPEDVLVDRQRRQGLLAVIRALPEKERSCLYLRAEGFRYREIAGILGISLGAVSISLTRALGKLARVDGGWM